MLVVLGLLFALYDSAGLFSEPKGISLWLSGEGVLKIVPVVSAVVPLKPDYFLM